MRRKLSNGLTYGYDINNKRICTGAGMGRRNILPDDKSLSLKLNMVRLRWVDGDYDQGGAYWGRTKDWGEHIYWAYHDSFEVFVRGTTREKAKLEVWQLLPNTKFYR